MCENQTKLLYRLGSVSSLKECHPRCVYQNYNRSMITEMAVKTQLYL